jgi:hypothetical protein
VVTEDEAREHVMKAVWDAADDLIGQQRDPSAVLDAARRNVEMLTGQPALARFVNGGRGIEVVTPVIDRRALG